MYIRRQNNSHSEKKFCAIFCVFRCSYQLLILCCPECKQTKSLKPFHFCISELYFLMMIFFEEVRSVWHSLPILFTVRCFLFLIITFVLMARTNILIFTVSHHRVAESRSKFAQKLGEDQRNWRIGQRGRKHQKRH